PEPACSYMPCDKPEPVKEPQLPKLPDNPKHKG
ncbi:MAG: hypothetical protein JWQ54_2023, partial [Mucilaginibacter sp.]|nr:hypothetical protein [Mucilaginibacter sp.]